MALHCDWCEILLRGPQERSAIGGKCPSCERPMEKTRPITQEERQQLFGLIREGKTRVEGDEQNN